MIETACTMARRAAGLTAIIVVSVGGASAQQAQPPVFDADSVPILENSSAEFPPIGPGFSTMRSGLLAARAARMLEQAPASPETFELLVRMERRAEANEVLRRLIQADDTSLVEAFELLRACGNLCVAAPADGSENPVPALIADARRALDRLTRDQAARLERTLILVEAGMRFLETRSVAARTTERDAALRDLIARYPETDAALEAEVDLITSIATPPAARIRPLEEFAARHPGTTAAARALYLKASQLSRNLNPAGVDPTDRFLEVLAIAADLGSGRYPPSEWVSRGPSLAAGLNPRDPVFAGGNAVRLLAAYVAFVRDHFTLPEGSQAAEDLAAFISLRIFDLFNARDEGVVGVERTLADLERIDGPRARDILARFYIGRLDQEPAAMRAALLQKAHDTLAAQLQEADGLYRRRALAMQASLFYAERDFAMARTAFADYLAAYPDTAWSWVAALRVGQCHLLLGDPDAAAVAFRSAARRYATVPVARQLGHAYAGHAAEAASRFDEAAADYERALEEWGDLQRTVRMESSRVRDIPNDWPFVEVQGLALRDRVAQLRASMPLPEGRLFERSRWLAAIGNRAGALASLDAFLRDYPDSTLVPDARRLAHRMRLDAALDMAAPSGASPDTAGAIDALSVLAREPWDEVIAISKIAQAVLLARAGADDRAQALISEALDEWLARQTTSASSGLPTDVARDVADIRRRVFEDATAGASWTGRFEWRPFDDPRYHVVNPDIAVKLGDGVPTRETVYQPSTLTNLLFADTEEMTLLVETMNRLVPPVRGPEGGPPGPVPPEMRSLLTSYLPVDPGMLGGFWSFTSRPEITAVHFTDEARTRAVVGFRAFHSGGNLLLEKQESGWQVVGVGGTYVN